MRAVPLVSWCVYSVKGKRGARRGPLAATPRGSGQREREERVKGLCASFFFFFFFCIRNTFLSSFSTRTLLHAAPARLTQFLSASASHPFRSVSVSSVARLFSSAGNSGHTSSRASSSSPLFRLFFFCNPKQCSAAQQPSWRRGPWRRPRARSVLALQRARGRRQVPRLSAPRRSSPPLVPRRLNGQLRRRRSSALLLLPSSSGALGALPPTPRRRQRTRKGWPRPRASASRRSSRRSSSST